MVTDPIHNGSLNGDLVEETRPVKMSLRVKTVAFIMTVLTLSWFFEGWREVQSGVTLPHCAMLLWGITSTLAMLSVQAYWIYVEEKTKGTLKRRIGVFERVYAATPLRPGPRGSGHNAKESKGR